MLLTRQRCNDVVLGEKQRLRGILDQLRLSAQLTSANSRLNHVWLPPSLAHNAITRQCYRNMILAVKATGHVSIIRQAFAAYTVSLS